MSGAEFSPAILIPVYRHGRACADVVAALAPLCEGRGIPLILVDDGNDDETRGILEGIAAARPFVTLVRLERNGGKGRAFRAGVMAAEERGLSHVLQIDADGQHDVSRAGFFLDRARGRPDALVCGFPEYDETAPNHRKGAHKFANWWCAVVTWRRGIVDSLCGFRSYPVDAAARLLRSSSLDGRMAFDIDILIRLIWRGVPFEFHPVRVTYPADGVSNFRPFRDNVRISWVFTKFFCGMLLRAPIFLWRKLSGRW